jgi:hypothetical protein
MTIVVAQRMAVRKGMRIQKVAAMSMPMKSTRSIVRVRSVATVVFSFISGFMLYHSRFGGYFHTVALRERC